MRFLSTSATDPLDEPEMATGHSMPIVFHPDQQHAASPVGEADDRLDQVRVAEPPRSSPLNSTVKLSPASMYCRTSSVAKTATCPRRRFARPVYQGARGAPLPTNPVRPVLAHFT